MVAVEREGVQVQEPTARCSGYEGSPDWAPLIVRRCQSVGEEQESHEVHEEARW